MKKLNKKGFTIVELVIVIAVIAILAAVLIPTFSGVVEKANVSAAQQEAKNLYTNYVANNAETGSFEDNMWILTSNGYYVQIKDAGVVTSNTTKTAPTTKGAEICKTDAVTEQAPVFTKATSYTAGTQYYTKGASSTTKGDLCDGTNLYVEASGVSAAYFTEYYTLKTAYDSTSETAPVFEKATAYDNTKTYYTVDEEDVNVTVGEFCDGTNNYDQADGVTADCFAEYFTKTGEYVAPVDATYYTEGNVHFYAVTD